MSLPLGKVKDMNRADGQWIYSVPNCVQDRLPVPCKCFSSF